MAELESDVQYYLNEARDSGKEKAEKAISSCILHKGSRLQRAKLRLKRAGEEERQASYKEHCIDKSRLSVKEPPRKETIAAISEKVRFADVEKQYGTLKKLMADAAREFDISYLKTVNNILLDEIGVAKETIKTADRKTLENLTKYAKKISDVRQTIANQLRKRGASLPPAKTEEGLPEAIAEEVAARETPSTPATGDPCADIAKCMWLKKLTIGVDRSTAEKQALGKVSRKLKKKGNPTLLSKSNFPFEVRCYNSNATDVAKTVAAGYSNTMNNAIIREYLTNSIEDGDEGVGADYCVFLERGKHIDTCNPDDHIGTKPDGICKASGSANK